ncbi:hypothetical protein SSX86_006916 [Deinandra increscens subsp. villosa]|uniref:DUF674 family protein n=1 Tax=Deinandra increscens subsp. villosa TaxID=3103831 RepID=A0AAP0DNQ7_9ASTR
MADSKAKEAKISIKLVVDKVNKRVVYAEADHTFVDILFSLMTIPLGTIVKLLGKFSDKNFEALGSLNNLYQSLKDIPECYLATEECKFMLLNPKNQSYYHCQNLKLKIDDTEPMKYFTCTKRDCYRFFSICNNAKCTICGNLMNIPRCFFWPIVRVGADGGVFVSDIATFIVTDDFSVMPYTATDVFRLLKNCGITDLTHLEERKLNLCSEQMLNLLQMALTLDSPLTCYVFHENNPFLDLVRPGQRVTFDQSHPMKKEEYTSSKMVLEVTLQKSTGKLLFAEAKEDFVDFVFGFLSIPLGTVIGTLLKGSSSITCMDNVFRSISNMSVGRYLKSQDIKNMLVEPCFGQGYTSKNITFPLTGTVTTKKGAFFNYQLKDPRIKEAFLKESGMFFVTDDLLITPSTSHLAINTLIKSKVKVDDIEKYEISIGLEEGLKMLKASLRSKSTLTNIIEHQLRK